MSADEIRRLAEELKPEEGHYSCDIKTLEPVHSALLAYAAMIGRCEDARAKIAKHNKVFNGVWGHDDVFDGNKLIDYIMKERPMERSTNALAELAEFLGKEAEHPSDLFRQKIIEKMGVDVYERYIAKKQKFAKAQRIFSELAKVNHGDASPTPWMAHTDREVRANDERLWIKGVVCQTQSCPKTRYTKVEREEWDIPATANTELIVASVNAVAKCRAIAEEGEKK